MIKFLDSIQTPVLSESEKDVLGLTLTESDDGLRVLYFKQVGTSPNQFKTIDTWWNGIELKWDEAVDRDSSGDLVITDTIDLGGGLVYKGASNITLNSNTNNLDVPDLSDNILLRVSCNGDRRLTGLVNPNMGKSTVIHIQNVGTGDLLLRNNNVLSTAQNRFIMSGNERLDSNEGVIIIYDTISLRWRISAIYQ